MSVVEPTRRSERLTPLPERTLLRARLSACTRNAETELLPGLVDQARLSAQQASAVHAMALRIARGVRERSRGTGRAGLVQGLLQEFALSSQEGVALMCLAEALLRIPDSATRDALIRDKIAPGNWQQHLGQSPSLFVNAAAWGLLLTGILVATHSDDGLSATLRRVVARGGEPLVRKGVDMAMRLMGEQFVTGESIEQALANARPREAQGFRYSYDMLGEAALTAADAQRYLDAYEQAIHAIGAAAGGRGIVQGPGISVKLSALHPRYARAQVERVMTELAPRVLQLALLARRYDIALSLVPGDRPTLYAYLAGRWRAGLLLPTRKERWKRRFLDLWVAFDERDTHTVAMHLLQAGVDLSVIALWLGHESMQTTHGYLEADLATKEHVLEKVTPAGQPVKRFKADDTLLHFLATL